MIVYIREQGALVQRSGNTLEVLCEGQKRTLFPHRMERLVVLGNVTLTPSAISLLCREGIDTFLLTRYGRFKGRLEGLEGKNVFLARRQFESLSDPEFCLKVVRALVAGKVTNMMTLGGRLKRRNKQLPPSEFEGPLGAMQELSERIRKAETTDSLRGLEGLATRHFFAVMRLGFKQELGFHKRVRRPPTDPVNSVLSLLYTLTFNRVHSAVRIAGLHPMPGYLHSLDYGRHSLALDLMEEFRSLVAETTTLSLFNLKILQREDFHYEAPPQPEPVAQATAHISDDPLGAFYENADDGFFDVGEQRIDEGPSEEVEPRALQPCRLNADALKRVVTAFEEKIGSEFTHPLTGTPTSYAEAMVQQALQFREVLEGQRALYQPLQLK
jgi:CRISPR-associated protein Cas1